jgi:hypothetical protein
MKGKKISGTMDGACDDKFLYKILRITFPLYMLFCLSADRAGKRLGLHNGSGSLRAPAQLGNIPAYCSAKLSDGAPAFAFSACAIRWFYIILRGRLNEI